MLRGALNGPFSEPFIGENVAGLPGRLGFEGDLAAGTWLCWAGSSNDIVRMLAANVITAELCLLQISTRWWRRWRNTRSSPGNDQAGRTHLRNLSGQISKRRAEP